MEGGIIMFFDKEFFIKKDYYKTFKEFYNIVKYYLKEYKKNKDIEIIIDKKNFCVIFRGKGNLCFY